PKKIAGIVAEMLTERQMFVRRLREGGEFFGYLKERGVQVKQRKQEAIANR
ncbi:MAG: hopanoid biosynthesis associated radical SAM protein HpnJ, partial [Armatimonadetes bacterium]|nr:hopanoid biosynthesis associated radical SAM protein HpnJ [Armatimonadota bacterium]